MPVRALLVVLLCAAVLGSLSVTAVHALAGLGTTVDAPSAAAPVVADGPSVPAPSVPAPSATASSDPVSPAASAPQEDTPAGTRRVNLRPVDASGDPAPGWTVSRGDVQEVECGYPSPAAVSPGIQTCSPTAAGADVCWPGPGGRTVTCLMDPWTTELIRYPATGATVQVAATEDPAPLGLELTDGTRCRLRNGGAWSGRDDDPDAYGAYSCSADDEEIVWADPEGDPVDDSAATWTVRVGTPSGPLRTLPVAVAYYAA